MAPKITKVSNPGTDKITFMVTAEDGERFAIDCTPGQSVLAAATLRRYLSDYERKRMAKFVKDVEPLLKQTYREGHMHPKEGN